MKRFKITVAILFLVSYSAYASETEDCGSKASTQLEINQCAGLRFDEADAELNRVYKLIKAAYSDNPQFLKKLQTSQRLWIKLRDANLEMQFPLENKRMQYGSVYPMCFANKKADLTSERTAYLKQWLEGIEEGYICGGSVKLKNDTQEGKE